MPRTRWLAAMLLAIPGCVSLDETLRPVTIQGRAIASFFDLTLVASALVLAGVVGALAIILVRFRGAGEPSRREGNRGLEVAWTAAALILVFALFALAMRTMGAVEATDAPPAVRVQVVGHQWWWEFRYPDLGVVTANELHLPVGQPVDLRIDGADVVHSFWVPRLGWKRDAIPGKANTMRVQVEAPGTLDGACAEYCGAQHAWMRVRLVAVPAVQFDAWARGQAAGAPTPADDAGRRGLALFMASTCVNCHTIRGTPANATVGPDLTHLGSRSTLGAGALENTPDALRRWIANPRAAKPGALMPAYPNLSDAELSDLATYLEGLR